MIDLTDATGAPDEEDLVDFVRIGERVLRVPARPRVNVALRYFHDLQTVGTTGADLALLRSILGPEQFLALTGVEGLKVEQLDELTAAAARLAMGGAPSDGPGNGSSGPES